MNFNMKMLTLARETSGLTQSALAHAVGISQAHISQMEHGLEEPSEAVAKKLASELQVPIEFFYRPDETVSEGLVDFFHRRRHTLPAKPLKRAHALANTIRLELLRLLQGVELTEVQPWPVFSSEEHSPEEAAQMLRASWRLPAGPAPSLVGLVEAAGVPVVLCDLGHEKLRAISMPGIGGRHIVLLNRRMSASNLRFSMAHELGHLVMHVGTASTNLEAEADRFASEFLMPANDIRPQLRGVRFGDLGTLKHRWSVSLAALIRRARDLEQITDRQYAYMNMQLNNLPGGRKSEPGEFAYEEPGLVRHVIDFLITGLKYTISQVAQVMVALEETVRSRYLGDSTQRLRAVGAPGRKLYQLPVPPSSV